jgi:hypothetical protein
MADEIALAVIILVALLLLFVAIGEEVIGDE